MRTKNVLACLTIGAVFIASAIPANAATYTIQPGDTLGRIASQSGMSVQEIMDTNGITDANKILAGSSITLNNLPASQTDGVADSLYELFDAEYYAKRYPDVVAVYGISKEALYRHFTQYGMQEGRSLSPDFDVNAYRSAYPDLQEAFGDDISKYYEHYLTFGQAENRSLVTVDACIASGITVSDMNGKVVAAPVAASSGTTSHNPESSSGDEYYWLTGTWYCVETEVNADGVMQSQGHFPYELYTLIDNGDGTYSYYQVVSHGAWINGEFDNNPFDFSAYEDNQPPLFVYLYDEMAMENCGISIVGTASYLGVYDEGCIHKWTLKIPAVTEHNWVLSGVDYRCTNCNAFHYYSFNYSHIDKDNDDHCDICGIYSSPHDCIDEDSDNKCDICGNHTPHVDEDGNSYCDVCWTYLR